MIRSKNGTSTEAVIVIDDVRVRWRYSLETGCRYLCDEDGEMTTASCAHAYRAAIQIAESTLGIRAMTYQETA